VPTLNKVTLIGNIGQEPEIGSTNTGTKTASFSVATTEKYTDNQGVKKESTQWHNIACYKRLAEIAENYLKKGSPLFIEGKLNYRSWEDPQTGQKKYRTEIIANNIQML